MRINPKAKLDPSQVEDLRSKRSRHVDNIPPLRAARVVLQDAGEKIDRAGRHAELYKAEAVNPSFHRAIRKTRDALNWKRRAYRRQRKNDPDKGYV